MAELKTLCIDNTCLNTPTAIDYITEQGEEGKWKYRKWASGKIEQFYHESANIVFDKTFSTFDYWERTPLSPPISMSSVDFRLCAANVDGGSTWTGLLNNGIRIYTAKGAITGQRDMELYVYVAGQE